MPESKWSLPASDGKIIYGVLNKSKTGQNKKAILFVHGITGNPYQPAQTVMALTYPEQGYDVIRPYLYSASPNARNLKDCTLRIHASDVNDIAEHFSKDYSELFVVGHSYGGPSVMMSDTSRYTAISLWDPTYDPSAFIAQSIKPRGDDYALTTSMIFIIGKDMVEEGQTIDRAYCQNLAAQCTKPLQTILAGDGKWAKDRASYHEYAAGPNECIVIPDTLHCFWEEGTTEPLLEHTKKWFDQFSKI